jgi:hypothetical protein
LFFSELSKVISYQYLRSRLHLNFHPFKIVKVFIHPQFDIEFFIFFVDSVTFDEPLDNSSILILSMISQCSSKLSHSMHPPLTLKLLGSSVLNFRFVLSMLSSMVPSEVFLDFDGILLHPNLGFNAFKLFL